MDRSALLAAAAFVRLLIPMAGLDEAVDAGD
jgi:hypothetical protein